MLKLIAGAALAASLALVSGAAPDRAAATPAYPTVTAAPAPSAVPLVAAPAPQFGLAPQEHGHDSAAAPGQDADGFRAWIDRSPQHRAELLAFQDRLAQEGVAEIVPLWQLVRTSSSWRECGAEPFEIAPRDKWAHIVETLKFVRDRVVPAVGRVEAVSGYRNEHLNACSAGAPQSAHRLFYAIDLTPVNPAIDRAAMIHGICAAHARDGRAYQTGLGFYTGRRFHVDSNGYRKWGPDGRGASSPCVTGIA